ncbi:MAG: ribosome silencing factor [Reyranellaceae bacterium]
MRPPPRKSAPRPRRRENRRNTTIARPAKSAGPSDALRELILATLDDGKAEEISVIDLAGKSSMADYMVVASGRSSRQVGALAEQLIEKLKGAGYRSPSVEGRGQGDWVLVDAGDVVVHLFRPEIRSLYNLEKMWGMAAAEPAKPAKPARRKSPAQAKAPV